MAIAKGVGFLLVGMVFLSGCSTRAPLDRSSFRNDGMNIRADSQTGSPVGSVPDSEKISDPALVAAAIKSGDAQVESREYLAGAELYRRAYDAKPELSTLMALSRALRLGGQAQKAVLTLQHEQSRFGGTTPYLVELGRASLSGGYLPEAQVALEKATARPDGGWAAWLMMGVLQARRDQSAQARVSFEEAGRRASSEQERDAAQANAAFLMAQDGNVPGAIAILEPLAAKPNAHRKVVATLAILQGIGGDRARYLDTARRSGMSTAEVEEGSRWLDISGSEAASEVGSEKRVRAQTRRSASQRP